MKVELLSRLNSGEVLVCDGAMGTMLQSFGYTTGDPPEKWGVEHEESLRRVHSEYIEAGADIILTNTFGGSRPKLEKYGLGSEVEQLNRDLAQIAVDEASKAERKVYVAGDVGPTGEFMEPIGMLTESDMIEIFSQQIRALAQGGVDLIFIETMMDPNEAAAAVKAAKKVCDLPVFASMS
ncbi:homocysteine S-methyltransferase family protein, partial [Candidatus Poribacteria bacterium]|nr:homocysteine S-methyltransferase family protein [Candidatus Poribacteria bacterium]